MTKHSSIPLFLSRIKTKGVGSYTGNDCFKWVNDMRLMKRKIKKRDKNEETANPEKQIS